MLKKEVGYHITTSIEFTPLEKEGKSVLVPEAILEVRECRLRNHTIKDNMAKWKDFPTEDATWEG